MNLANTERIWEIQREITIRYRDEDAIKNGKIELEKHLLGNQSWATLAEKNDISPLSSNSIDISNYQTLNVPYLETLNFNWRMEIQL